MTIENPALTQTYSRVNGGGTTFTTGDTPFESDDVFVYVYNDSTGVYDLKTVTTDYTISGTTVTFNTATPSGTGNILILRRTDFNAAKIPNFTPGSSIRGEDLDKNFLQSIRVDQEFRDQKVDKASPEVWADLDMNDRRIGELGPALNDDEAVNRQQLGDVIALDITSSTVQGIELTKTESGSNSGDEMIISGINATRTQKGVLSIDEGEAIDLTINNGHVVVEAELSSKFNLGVVSINEGHAIGAHYTNGGCLISADKSTGSQQGVVKINAPSVANGNPITLDRPANGEVQLSIVDGSIDLAKIKPEDIITEAEQDILATSQFGGTGGPNDETVFTSGANAKRFDTIVQTNMPLGSDYQRGKGWLNTTPGNQEFRIWDGSNWQIVAVGQPFSPATTTIVRYVDATNGSDAASVSGFLPQSPLRSIKRAVDLINSDGSDGSLVLVAPGVYQETLPIQIQRNNVSIVGQALRSCFVQPTQATETNTMFECNSGTLIANMTLVGLKASGTRGNSTYDGDSTYGLPENQGWCAGFFNNAVIKKSPYIQNCTSFNDSSIDNSVKYDQTNLPAGGLGGDTTSTMSGGGILCDGSVPASSSPLRSFVVDSFTQINLDGPGILCTNNGYAQLVSFFGTFCHYHAKALNGGQLNLSNCTTDFGRYGLIADGRSATAQITGSSVGTAAAAATSVVVDGLAAQGGFFSNQPGSTMIMEVGGHDYQILDASQVSGNQCTINIYRATNADPNTNLGLVAQINNNTSVSFKLRSYISTGGHTFEYCGAGTDYSAHPDYGGQAVEANQVVELGGTGSANAQIYNRGKVWQSSTDENGLFKVGDKFKVDQRRGTITLDGYTVAAEVVSDTTPQLGGNLDLNSSDITGTGNVNVTGTVTATSFTGDGSNLTGVNVVNDTTPQLGGSLDVNGNSIVSVSNGNITLAPNGTGEVDIDSTTAIIVPVGTTAERPSTPESGMIRFNSTTGKYESYDGTNWGSLVGGDIGTAPENIPINQYLGKQAFVDEVGTLRPYFPTGSFYSAPQDKGDIQFRYVSDTSIKIVMKGLDGTIRSTTLTLS